MDERTLREKQWHEHSYSEGAREGCAKYYRFGDSWLKFFNELLISYSRGRRVLESGCGHGEVARMLAEKGISVTAIDLSETAIEQARSTAESKNLSNVDYLVMNAHELEFEDATFDVVYGTAILHHLDLPKALSEVARVLRPEGVAIFAEPLGHNPLVNLYRKLTPRLRTDDERPLRVEELKLAQLFFERVDVYYFHLLFLLAMPLAALPFNIDRFSGLLRILETADRSLFRRVPFMGRYAWLAVMVLRSPRAPKRLYGVPAQSGPIPDSREVR